MDNMLAGITGNLYLAKQYSVDNPYVLQKLGNVESLSYRAAEMIKQLLTFARKDVVNMKQLPITSFIKETLKLLQSSVPENIDLNHHICTDALIVKADATQIHQMLLNLINNACDALEDAVKPRITINLEAVHVDDAFIKKHLGFITGEYAHLSVHDNGCGIPESMTDLLFEPFSTTKEVGKGTGLGLAMVFGAVKNHQGFIEVESIQNEGSTFHIYFPLALVKSNDVLSQNQGIEVTKRAQGETILFVDDQEDIVETTSEFLESIGYQVITAANGEQAVEAFKAQAANIDLIIMDVVMPIMSGDQAAQLIRQLNPNIKIIFSTGYDKFAQLEMNHEVVISKPFSIEKMSNLIRQTIDS
ncbi:MAG: ATP-binding protein [Ghiorsea sp.]